MFIPVRRNHERIFRELLEIKGQGTHRRARVELPFCNHGFQLLSSRSRGFLKPIRLAKLLEMWFNFNNLSL